MLASANSSIRAANMCPIVPLRTKQIYPSSRCDGVHSWLSTGWSRVGCYVAPEGFGSRIEGPPPDAPMAVRGAHYLASQLLLLPQKSPEKFKECSTCDVVTRVAPSALGTHHPKRRP
jgi:hypothetical protein